MAKRTAEHNAKIGAALRARGVGASETKLCPRCQQVLPRDTFATRPSGHSASYCQPCDRAFAAARQRKLMATSPAARQRSRDINRRTALRRYHGVSVEDYDRMFASQNGVCAICRSASTQRGRTNLDIDHCHVTNVIRGLLCAHCNRAIGLLGDDPAKLRRAADYLETSRWPDIVRDTSTKPDLRRRQRIK